MFKIRYWREYPLLLQASLLFLMMYSLYFFGVVVAKVIMTNVLHVVPLDILDLGENSSSNLKQATLLLQGITSFFAFVLPALIFAYFTHPKPLNYLGFRKPGRPVQWVLVVFVILGALPVLLGIESLVRNIDLGENFRRMQEQNDNMTKAFLTMNAPGDIFKVFLTLAILPAIGEEMIFRGLVMRLIYKRNHNIGISIAITSLVFAIFHANPTGLFSIFFAAVLLGYIYYLTGSLWMSILAHIINNGLQVLVYYWGNYNSSVKTFIEGDSLPLWMPFAGAAILSISLYLLWKNRTPLPSNWADDFTAEELESRKS